LHAFWANSKFLPPVNGNERRAEPHLPAMECTQMRGLLAGVLAVSLGMAAVGPAFAKDSKEAAMKKCEAIKDKAKHDACVAKVEKMK
jgi:hypothetical protein